MGPDLIASLQYCTYIVLLGKLTDTLETLPASG